MRTLTGVGCVAAALLLAAPARAQMSGGGGTFSGGGGSGFSSGGGGGGGGSSGSASNSNFAITGQQLQQGIVSDSLLGSFNNVGTGTTGRGSSASSVSPSNPLAAYYYNPMAQGLMNSSTGGTTSNPTAFGQPLYGNLTTGTSGTLGGRGTGSAFGGTSGSSMGSFGSIGSTGSRTGSTGSLSGSATIRGGTSGTIAPGFTGGTWGPAIGRRGPVMAAGLRTPPRQIPVAARRPDLQAIIARSTTISSPAGITVTAEGDTVVLTGRVATDDDKRIAENMLRLHPGVHAVRNDLQVTTPAGP